jgi:hypothetical protein
MSRENPLWGVPRIHVELVKLGIDVGETNVSEYLVRHRKATLADLANLPGKSRQDHPESALYVQLRKAATLEM